jgi:hypothetical protein
MANTPSAKGGNMQIARAAGRRGGYATARRERQRHDGGGQALVFLPAMPAAAGVSRTQRRQLHSSLLLAPSTAESPDRQDAICAVHRGDVYMQLLLTGPAVERPCLLDRLTLAIDPANSQRTIAYEEAMRSRATGDLPSSRQSRRNWCKSEMAIAAVRAELVRPLEARVGTLSVCWGRMCNGQSPGST